MGSENRPWKWVVIFGFTALAALVLYPPGDKLKPGIDLAGGTSLIYEIDTTGLHESEKEDLADRVMNILKARVDPNSQFNLIWRPIGNNRLEIQMPRPPKDAGDRRDKYEKVRDKIRAKNVSKTELESALTADDRSAALASLARGVSGRMERLEAVGAAWDAYLAVQGGDDFEAEYNARTAYEESLEKVAGTNLAVGRLTDVLALRGDEREAELERLRTEYPSYVAEINETLERYDVWAKDRGSLEDPEDLKRLLKGAGVLEFRILAERQSSNPTMLASDDPSLREPVAKYSDQLAKRGPRVKADDRYAWFPIDDLVKFTSTDNMQQALDRMNRSTVIEKYAGKYYVLAHVADERLGHFGLTQRTKWSLKRAMVSTDYSSGRPCVNFSLDARGASQFSKVTGENLKRQLAIFLDGVATSHATIETEIAGDGRITGQFTIERVREIVQKLEAGSLPARLKETPLHEKSTGPSIGEQNRDMGIKAALYGLIAVVVFMLVYYLYLGLLADVALLLNLLFVLAIMAGLEATFTLQGIAGLILTVGMAVDANVLIFERIREERARGVALKKAVKIGYDKAFSTIVDANLTTLITCVILGYVGSEEVKGFAITLGFGLVTSMFTALFVTRVILTSLINVGLVKSLPMLHLIGRPNINWIGLRKGFWPVSCILVFCGIGLFGYVSMTDKESIFDIEFLGGTNVQIELADDVHMNIDEVRDVIQKNAVAWLHDAAKSMEKLQVAPVPNEAGVFEVSSDVLTPTEVDVLLRTTFEDHLVLGGFTSEGSKSRFVTRTMEVAKIGEDGEKQMTEEIVDQAAFQAGIVEAAAYVENAASLLEGARIQSVADIDDTSGEDRAFDVITVESNKELVRAAILGTIGDKLKVERAIRYKLYVDAMKAPEGLFPIKEEHSNLGQVIGGELAYDVSDFKGGVALVFEQLDPPVGKDMLEQRFKEMRLQPQFEQYESRESEVKVLDEAGVGADGKPTYSKFALLVGDESLIYDDDPISWRERLAEPELQQAEEALSSEKTLRKVVQFAPQIAAKTQQQALISMVLALAAIVAYVWIRFGTMQYGLAAIVALVHDVSIVLGLIAVTDWVGIGGGFRIDLAMIAALLTVVGYSLNDTIVIFDRIRENRGKLSKLSPNMINNSINMTLSRTLLTSLTTLVVVAALFALGGEGVHGFAFALLGGVIVGTYSSVGIAAPLLQNRKLLHFIIYILVGAAVTGLAAVSVGNSIFTLVIAAIMIILIIALSVIERGLDEPSAG